MTQVTILRTHLYSAVCHIEATRNEAGQWILLRRIRENLGPAGSVIKDAAIIAALDRAEAEDREKGIVRTPC